VQAVIRGKLADVVGNSTGFELRTLKGKALNTFRGALRSWILIFFFTKVSVILFKFSLHEVHEMNV
jgi:hypothetical protein